jgi:hypothetical protein
MGFVPKRALSVDPKAFGLFVSQPIISAGKSGMVTFIQLFADKIGTLLGKMHE